MLCECVLYKEIMHEVILMLNVNHLGKTVAIFSTSKIKWLTVLKEAQPKVMWDR